MHNGLGLGVIPALESCGSLSLNLLTSFWSLRRASSCDTCDRSLIASILRREGEKREGRKGKGREGRERRKEEREGEAGRG